MSETTGVINREKLLDALGLEADRADERMVVAATSGDNATYYMHRGLAAGCRHLFDLVAKFPYQEKAE